MVFISEQIEVPTAKLAEKSYSLLVFQIKNNDIREDKNDYIHMKKQIVQKTQSASFDCVFWTIIYTSSCLTL
ncbi:hypothetical protein I580_00264 [Enterococcus caccae ATCC BAA-1240]|uniref:Uncharacterized protein n=1 Tax=Enterococcus caccae ATCC BAA-1240 TaxID=1158612 RepID=R3TRE0_9ENTE|nr:hypothetical protein UC7_03048 [Enterococcus caccae ATCC BAA-1240]EOT67882.1 hypothetical protein I580_00264 [Enterococcus caccae ATCC BAA-1240]